MDDFTFIVGHHHRLALVRNPPSLTDQSFVQDIATDKNDRVIVLTTITIAHSIAMEVIAEGVEAKEQRDFLVENGCENL